MDIKKKIIIKGQRVHDIGYRPYLLGIADSLEIERFFAKNILIFPQNFLKKVKLKMSKWKIQSGM